MEWFHGGYPGNYAWSQPTLRPMSKQKTLASVWFADSAQTKDDRSVLIGQPRMDNSYVIISFLELFW